MNFTKSVTYVPRTFCYLSTRSLHLAGASGIVSAFEKEEIDVSSELKLDWDTKYLCFSVREPWPSRTSSAGITFGKITSNSPLKIVSQMPENGVIFSDGIEKDFLEFNSGTQATISIAEKEGQLIV